MRAGRGISRQPGATSPDGVCESVPLPVNRSEGGHAKPYRLWAVTAPFTKDGIPLVGTFGKSAQRVVIMTADTFERLIAATPALATARFEIGELDA